VVVPRIGAIDVGELWGRVPSNDGVLDGIGSASAVETAAELGRGVTADSGVREIHLDWVEGAIAKSFDPAASISGRVVADRGIGPSQRYLVLGRAKENAATIGCIVAGQGGVEAIHRAGVTDAPPVRTSMIFHKNGVG